MPRRNVVERGRFGCAKVGMRGEHRPWSWPSDVRLVAALVQFGRQQQLAWRLLLWASLLSTLELLVIRCAKQFEYSFTDKANMVSHGCSSWPPDAHPRYKR